MSVLLVRDDSVGGLFELLRLSLDFSRIEQTKGKSNPNFVIRELVRISQVPTIVEIDRIDSLPLPIQLPDDEKVALVVEESEDEVWVQTRPELVLVAQTQGLFLSGQGLVRVKALERLMAFKYSYLLWHKRWYSRVSPSSP